ncbi:SIMPL domain-containing protein [Actinoplanes utahensis]
MPALVALAALAVPSSALLTGRPAVAAPAPTSAPAPAEKPWESIVVSGEGEVSGTPDTVTATFGVETSAPTVGEALDRANTAATRMRDALVGAGLAKADLQTSNVDINATRDDDQKITGYTVNQGLTAKSRDLARVGAVISAAVAAGGDAARLNGVAFAIEDDTALLTEARKKAFAEARAKAELYAREAGRPLGRVVRVSEATDGDETPVYKQHYYSGMAAADSATVPIEPGRQSVSVTVTVEWTLG